MNDIQEWIATNLQRSREHRKKHVLANHHIPVTTMRRTALAGQLLTNMLQDETYTTSSGFNNTDIFKIDAYIAHEIYKKLSKIKQSELLKLTDKLSRYGSATINIPMPAIQDSDKNIHILDNICLTRNPEEHNIKIQTSDRIAIVINKNKDAYIPNDTVLSLHQILNKTHIASTYPTTEVSKPSIGKAANTETTYVNITNALLKYNNDELNQMDIYERMDWLTSDVNEIQNLYPVREIYPTLKLIVFEQIDQHVDANKTIKSYDVKFNEQGGWYASHLPSHMRNQRTWHDLREYTGALQGLSTLKYKYEEMLNNDPELKNMLRLVENQPDNELEY